MTPLESFRTLPEKDQATVMHCMYNLMKFSGWLASFRDPFTYVLKEIAERWIKVVDQQEDVK